MKIFLDSAHIEEIRELAQTGLIDGVTTNPSLVARSGQKREEVIARICEIISGPVSAEVLSLSCDEMVDEGRALHTIAPQVVVKVPLTSEGLKACVLLRQEGIGVNVTLCFSPAQALLAAKAGATFVSPFVGRLDDLSVDGLALIDQICQIYKNYSEFKTEILAASIRHPLHVVQAARWGAHVVTLSAKIFRQLYEHPLTEKGLEIFLKEANESLRARV